jgi:two-component system sensor histidine kinase/response regulator
LKNKTGGHIFEEIRPLVTIIHRTSHRIFQQLNELIEWAQTQRDKPALKPEKVKLVRGVNQSLELLKDIAIQKKIVLENKVPTDIYVNADYIMLRSIVQNLVTNAIKFTPQHGSITINAQRVGKSVEVRICDSGIGMEAKVRDNLFLDANVTSLAGTNNENGTGLGLVLVKDFVIRHGGALRIESELEKGSCIIFTLSAYGNKRAHM